MRFTESIVLAILAATTSAAPVENKAGDKRTPAAGKEYLHLAGDRAPVAGKEYLHLLGEVLDKRAAGKDADVLDKRETQQK
ncbi:uncharacterized protein BBA_06803 [Beauveria bassiana ARSEF 2860]|uniref:Uncharacterized protein n=1 Tax=Beauveria bassiana (strain ARSEF 2860) TaxID=655819 RepID=J4KMK2_BEAB2|nr:uncharacterized protein BBA_06803 [Beauveria bassiana ARSEF 2860]EJP64099.1 hypothetical protein BBA_06803 [Beauveria bassiana ARSEF 2860]